MHGTPKYLKPEVKIEPLVARWHAWPHLASPAQLAMHLGGRLLPLLKSFADSPAAHVAASADPKLYGGPFVGLAEAQVDAVRTLLADTQARAQALLALGSDLKWLESTLQEKMSGYSLDEFYAQLPASLRGLVELVYDLNHHPGFRLFESLLYREDLTVPLQEIWLHATPESEREFFMSTPRLPRAGTVSLRLPFADRRLDALNAMRTVPGSVPELAQALGVQPADLPAFDALFTADAPPQRPERRYQGDGVRMRYFGHACVLLETDAGAILIDPFLSMEPGQDQRLCVYDLPDRIDYVLITHCHQDHFSMEMLLQLRDRIGCVVVPANNGGSLADPSMALLLRDLGFEHVVILQPFDTLAVPGGQLQSLPFTGEHADLDIHSKQALALTLRERRFLFLIDSDGRDNMLYQRIMQVIGKVDVLFIGMECHGAPLNWLYEPLLGRPVTRRNNESRRLSGANCERAWNILQQVQARRVFVYAMGQEPWMKFMMGLQYEPDSIQLLESDRFIEQCQRADIQCERLYLSREVIFGGV